MDSDAQGKGAEPGRPRPDTKLLRLESLTTPPPEHGPSPLQKYQHPPRDRHPLRPLRIVIFLAVLAVIGAVVLTLYRREMAIQRRKAAIILQARVEEGRQLRSKIAKTVQHVLDMSGSIADDAAAANEAAMFVMNGPAVTPPPAEPATPTEPEPRPEPEPEPEGADAVAPPEGILSREQIERQRRRTLPPRPVAPPPVVREAPAVREAPKRSEIELLAESTREEAEEAAKAAALAREIDAKSNGIEQRIVLSTTAAQTEKPTKELRELLTAVRDLDKQLSAVLPEVRKKKRNM